MYLDMNAKDVRTIILELKKSNTGTWGDGKGHEALIANLKRQLAEQGCDAEGMARVAKYNTKLEDKS